MIQGSPTIYRKAFESADELRAMRHAAGWTQRELAIRAGVHVCTVKYHEGRPGRIRGYAPSRFLKALAVVGISEAPANSRKPKDHPCKCGARTRHGTTCKARPVAGRTRCKLHGGLSTGPKTAEGRDRIAAAQRLRWRGY